MDQSAQLRLEGVVGSSRHSNSLLLTAQGKLVYALGCSLVVREPGITAVQLLPGHENEVTCLAASLCGRYLASGEQAPLGFGADVLLWDLRTLTMLRRLRLHRIAVQALAFSPCSAYLASLGGPDDGSLVIWDVASGTGLCGAPAHNYPAAAVTFLNRSSTRLLTGGKQHLRLWELDISNKKLHPADVALGTLRRDVTALAVDPADCMLYAATTTGDVLQVNVARGMLRNSGPAKPALHNGITSMLLLPTEGQVVLGGGDGCLSVVAVDTNPSADPKSLQKHRTVVTTRIAGHALASVALDAACSGSGRYVFYCSTAGSELYRITYSAKDSSITHELLQTAHASRVRDVAFPAGYSQVFATCGGSDVRVWQLAQPCRQLLLAAVTGGAECLCVAFAQDGKSILSGWSDGRIRAFGPQSGKLLYTINNAHPAGVSAIAGTPDSAHIISGDEDGCVRAWQIGRESQVLLHTMKEQAAAINCIQLRPDGKQFATASSDGSLIIWCSASYRRVAQLLENTAVKSVCWHPDGLEVVTTGSNVLTYYDAHSGASLRKVQTGEEEHLNSIALDASGELLASGGSNGQVKLWSFVEGRQLAVGQAHSRAVERVCFSPDGCRVVTVGAEGAICVWSLAVKLTAA